MPRTKGSKNCVTASTDCDAQIAKLQKDKALLEGVPRLSPRSKG